MNNNPRPAYESYVDTLLKVLSRSPERPALITAEGRTVLAGELRDDVRRTAAELAGRGIGRGSTVVFLTGNQPEALLARYAVNLLGARAVFLDQGTAPEAQARIVATVGASMLLVAPATREAAEALRALAPVPAVFTLGPAAFGEDLLAHAALRAPERVVSTVRAEDDWCIRFTGGTTGTPKGIRMAHGPYREALALHAGRIPSGSRPRFLACTPLAHMAGIVADITLLAGGTVVLRPAFDAGEVLTVLGRERITDIWLLPPLLYELLDHPALPGTDVSALRRVFYGGTAASARRLRDAAEAFGPVLHGWYGQTEAGNIAEVLPHEHGVTGRGGRSTAGRAAPGAEIEIRDADGEVLAAGESGEICVRTPMMMSGYWRQPDLTAEVLRDGWVRTGDVGYVDAEGYLFLVDRLKDMVVVVGGHVYPAELEQLLLEHPAVARCAAFGVRRADESEEVHVAIVPAAGSQVGLDAIREFVTERKGAMYAPRAVHIVDRIPLTGVGKPDKKLLSTTWAPDPSSPTAI
ncbi:fatty acid--CoA ligase [Streptomyces eurocidicus]|uniref:Fatty acid--CoA ligase n=1 Tax=Streptomyces eurocidicus TaxID=66423 RepID=A0A2N8NUE6_STREU|nr:AMP-binding protein [Streptomyces eurocidicus]MBB5120250.1 fatty-acyl-CoA synthase [Streptomyces eurocidicus]MBF6056067.1 AMP-binding protein [Streptomyces eurocidicus]PNE32397.1 fatty acid--CoA ligase [Streptomyces eurocidicus]